MNAIDAPQVAARALRARIVAGRRSSVSAARGAGIVRRAASSRDVAVTRPQQRAVAAEAGAERGQPPPAAGRVVGERRLEHEVDEGARQVAVLAQHRRAVAERVAVELEAFSSASSTSRPPACMIQAAMSRACRPARRAPSSSTRSRVLGGERRHLARQDVAQHAAALLEHQRLALGRARSARRCRSIRCGAAPPGARARARRRRRRRRTGRR